MKNNLLKLISLILVLAFTLSLFTVFAFAETAGDDTVGEDTPATDEEVEKKTPTVLYNRDYSDGWGVYNGVGDPISIEKNNYFHIDYEMTSDYRYNYFARMEARSGEDGFIQLPFSEAMFPKKDKVYIEFDLKADDYVSLGTILYSRFEGGGTNNGTVSLFSILENKLYPFCDSKLQGITLENQWVSVRIVYDYTNEELCAQQTVPVTIEMTSGDTFVSETRAMKTAVSESSSIGLDFLRFGFPGADDPSVRYGMSYCLDNLRAYCGVTEPMTETDWIGVGYGLCVDENQVKTENILGGADSMSDNEHLENALIMKVGVEYALLNNEKVTISELEGEYVTLPGGEPVELDGQVLVPLSAILQYIGYPCYSHKDGQSIDISTGTSATYITLGRNSATVAGETVYLDFAPAIYSNAETGTSYPVVSINDVEALFPGYYVTYDNMGLIIICQKDEILNRDEHLQAMLELMKKFIFNFVDEQTVYNDVYENTAGFVHPFLLGDQSVFDRITAIYDGSDTTEYDVDLEKEITEQVKWAFTLYERFANPSSTEKIYKYEAAEGDTATHAYFDGEYLPAVNEEGAVLLSDGQYALCEEGRYALLDSGYVPAEDGAYVLTADGEYKESMEALYKACVDAETGEHEFDLKRNYDEWAGLDWSSTYTQGLYQPYGDMGGYDVGGRMGNAGSMLNHAYDMAFGYIVTGDIKLAQCAYAIMVEVGEWDHWGPGHFLNVSEASTPFAIALDWIYNGIAEIQTGDTDGDGYVDYEQGEWSLEYLQDLLYKNGVYEGILASTNQPTSWPRPAKFGGDVRYYSTMTNNWNSVCASGMWLAGIMLFENENYKDDAAWLVSDNIEKIAMYGLGQYAPDGSYVESPAYWGYGTNYLLHGVMGLWSAAGDDYGLLDTWGMDQTCYFACFVESSDYVAFSYHDASVGSSTDSISFLFMAEAMNDPTLAEIRKIHLQNGKGAGIRDFLFYPYEADAASGDSSDAELPLDYFMEGIDGYTTRSSWDKGALFAGIIGGDNAASHGQVDSGTFVYDNEGISWITDIGSEEYNVYNYFSTPDRYRYYKSNAEGNNTLALITQPEDVPYGQKSTGFGEVISTGSNGYGSLCIIDNTNVYGGYANAAYRGMLLTNNRQTLVIQDEVQVVGTNTFAWCAHFNNNQIKSELSSDGRTLYLYVEDQYGRKTSELRMTLVSSQTSLKFEITDCYEFMLTSPDNGTVSPSWTLSNGGQPEKSRNAYRRIVVKSDGLVVNMAVVFEMMDVKADNGGRDAEVGYSFVNMADWEPSADASVDVETEGEKRPAARVGEFSSNVNRAREYLHEDGTAFNTDYALFYRALTDAYYIYTTLEETVNTNASDMVAEYMSIRDEFQSFRQAVSEICVGRDGVIRSLMGMGG